MKGDSVFPWLSFLSYIIIVAYTPGPNNIMSMNNAKNAGFRKGIQFNLGIFAGCFVVMMLCLLFSAALYRLVPKVQLPMKILGAAYMAYLLVKTLLPSKEHETKNNNGSFIMGAVLQLINPKLMIYGITAISSYILPYYKAIPVLVLFVFLLSFVSFTATLCWALFGSLFKILFSKHAKIVNIIMALLLLYCAVSLFL
jgi:threonine/homoserine/homoserine lactone efflux protein